MVKAGMTLADDHEADEGDEAEEGEEEEAEEEGEAEEEEEEGSALLKSKDPTT